MRNIIFLPTEKDSKIYSVSDKRYFTSEKLSKISCNPHLINLYVYVTMPDLLIKKGDYGIGYARGIFGYGAGYYLFKHDGTARGRINAISKGAMKIVMTNDDELIENNIQEAPDELLEYLKRNQGCVSLKVKKIHEFGKIPNNEFLDNKSIYKIIIPVIDEDFDELQQHKSITFDKDAQNNLPEHIKAKMKLDRDGTTKRNKENVIESILNCPTCGGEVKIKGDTTHYCELKNHTNEEVKKIIKFALQKYGVYLTKDKIDDFFEEFKK